MSMTNQDGRQAQLAPGLLSTGYLHDGAISGKLCSVHRPASKPRLCIQDDPYCFTQSAGKHPPVLLAINTQRYLLEHSPQDRTNQISTRQSPSCPNFSAQFMADSRDRGKGPSYFNSC